jgi:hypothetical protein
MKREAFVAALAISFAILEATSAAHAQGPINIEEAAILGYGTAPGGSGNPYKLGLGLGARAGVSYAGVYAGLKFTRYFGTTATAPAAEIYYGSDSAGSVSESYTLFGVEAGYGITVAENVTVRAQVGIGNVATSQGTEAQGGEPSPTYSYNNLYYEPGVTCFIRLGRFLVGVDVNVLVIKVQPILLHGTTAEGAVTGHLQTGIFFW